MKVLDTIQECAVCGCEANMTRDHIVPSWLLFDCSRFDINWKELVEKNELGGKMWHLVCGPCNMAKGGTIDWKDPTVRIFMKGFIAALQEKIDYHEGPRKLKVVCGCGRKEPCAVVPTNMTSLVASVPIMEQVKQAHAGVHKPHHHGPGEICWCGYVPRNLRSQTG